MASPATAEDLDYEQLVPYWNGFYKERVFFTYSRCPNCSLLYNSTFFSAEQLAALYAQMPPNMESVEVASLEATQRDYFEALRSLAKLEKGYMEIGPDVGLFVENCVREGKFDHYWLFEPNRAVAPVLEDVVKGHAFTILPDMFDYAPVPDASVGAAVMIHVLDHLLDPMEALRAIRRKLVRGGKILIVTHDESSLLRRVFGQRFPPFCLQHPQLYNPGSVRSTLEVAGYKDVHVQRSSNHFPVHFLLKQFLWACGIKASRVPRFWSWSVRLRLGNILAVASA